MPGSTAVLGFSMTELYHLQALAQHFLDSKHILPQLDPEVIEINKFAEKLKEMVQSELMT